MPQENLLLNVWNGIQMKKYLSGFLLVLFVLNAVPLRSAHADNSGTPPQDGVISRAVKSVISTIRNIDQALMSTKMSDGFTDVGLDGAKVRVYKTSLLNYDPSPWSWKIVEDNGTEKAFKSAQDANLYAAALSQKKVDDARARMIAQ